MLKGSKPQETSTTTHISIRDVVVYTVKDFIAEEPYRSRYRFLLVTSECVARFEMSLENKHVIQSKEVLTTCFTKGLFLVCGTSLNMEH